MQVNQIYKYIDIYLYVIVKSLFICVYIYTYISYIKISIFTIKYILLIVFLWRTLIELS